MAVVHARRRRPTRLGLLALVVLAAAWWLTDGRVPVGPAAPTPSTTTAEGLAEVRAAFAERRGDLWVTLEGRVERVLDDDDEGSRHQRFVLRLADDLTLLVAHNIDLAPRVPLEVGDRVRARGEYEWNPRGGVLHWTHHDPGGRPGGWVELDGRRYR